MGEITRLIQYPAEFAAAFIPGVDLTGTIAVPAVGVLDGDAARIKRAEIPRRDRFVRTDAGKSIAAAINLSDRVDGRVPDGDAVQSVQTFGIDGLLHDRQPNIRFDVPQIEQNIIGRG